VRARVPLELQSLASLERRPRIVGNHRHAAERLEPDWRLPRIERDDLTDAAHGEHRLVVHGLQRRAEDGRVLDGGVQHAVDFGIHPEDSLAADDVAEVVDGVILADVPPRRPRLELQRLRIRDGKLCGCGHERAVCGAAARRLVHDLVEAGFALRRRHLPLRGGGLDQHHARRCAGLPERVEEVANGFRSVSVLIAVSRVADALRDLDARPIGVELVGGDHRQRRADARAHFRAVRHDVHGAVGIDAEIDRRMEGGAVHRRAEPERLLDRGLGHEAAGDHECTCRQDAAEKMTAADVCRDDRPALSERSESKRHDRVSAARLMAARMR
jgi:hypothetical protein